ncbi:MAG TPA: ATP-binding protein [Pyrinomonadaceae bacterium]|nr:ATP-binding protein [Pyrinomonadaceae bacterium]
MSNSDKNTPIERAMLGWMTEFAGLGLLVTDENLNIRACNKWFEKQSEKSEAELLNRQLLDVFPDLKARGFDRYYRDTLGGQSRILSHRLHKYLIPMTPSAGITTFAQMQQSARISPLFADDRVIGTITVIEDVTERVEREMELNVQLEERQRLLASEQAARELAEENSRLKDEFLASVSHEIRTPLNAINGWTQILLSSEANPEKFRHALNTIQRNVTSQMQIIDDLLDISRIVTGQMRLDLHTVNLADSIETALNNIRPAAHARHITIVETIESDSTLVMGDHSRLQQILWNLLSNAVKFTPVRGRIEVVLREVDDFAEIIIHDSGQGISYDFLPYVFERFRQADNSSKRKHGGLGLGLSIVKNLVELHGGTVTAESSGEGAGAIFTIMLPLLLIQKSNEFAQPAISAIRNAEGSFAGIRVLVVDDDADSRELLRYVLEDNEAQIITVAGALEALNQVSVFKPDILISDLGMPEMDGYDLIRQIRALPPENGGQTPAIALTGYVSAEEQKRVRAAGFDIHVAKPVDFHKLLEIIKSLLRRAGRI